MIKFLLYRDFFTRLFFDGTCFTALITTHKIEPEPSLLPFGYQNDNQKVFEELNHFL